MQISPEEIEAYLDALFAVVSADSLLDKQEILKIYELFTLFRVEPKKRREKIEGLIVNPSAFKTDKVHQTILTKEELKISLAKNLLLMQDHYYNNANLQAAKDLLNSIQLTPEQATVIKKFVLFENQILAALGAGQAWQADENSWREMVSRAAAVGVPLTALNVSGVAGFSAAGITSGLATLGGMSGLTVLGLNPMTAGIGALILGGVAVKKIADYVTSSDNQKQSDHFEEFKKTRLIAKEAISSDFQVLARGRKREILLPARKQRRDALRKSMTEALDEF